MLAFLLECCLLFQLQADDAGDADYILRALLFMLQRHAMSAVGLPAPFLVACWSVSVIRLRCLVC
jgi:hypothetical protein